MIAIGFKQEGKWWAGYDKKGDVFYRDHAPRIVFIEDQYHATIQQKVNEAITGMVTRHPVLLGHTVCLMTGELHVAEVKLTVSVEVPADVKVR